MHWMMSVVGSPVIEVVYEDHLYQAQVSVCRNCWEVILSHETQDPEILRVLIANRGNDSRDNCYEEEK